jgi:hypothetical protein
MSIELTEEQKAQLLEGNAIRITPPEIGEEIVLIRGEMYDEVHALLDDLKTSKAIADLAHTTAARWAQQNSYY